METEQFSLTILASNRVEAVEKLRALADNLDGTPATIAGKPAKSTSKPAPAKKTAPPPAAATEEDDDFKADDGASEPAGFDDDAAEEAPVEEESFEEESPKKPAAKAAAKGNGKAKKITLDDVNDACKAHAAAKGRPATLAVLQKKFKTQSVTALKPEQFEACISAMAVN